MSVKGKMKQHDTLSLRDLVRVFTSVSPAWTCAQGTAGYFSGLTCLKGAIRHRARFGESSER